MHTDADDQGHRGRLRLGAVVLAAGSGSRFSSRPGEKLVASLEDETVLDLVLHAVREHRPSATAVVLGFGAERIEQATEWAHEIRVRNEVPEQGIASSLRVGIEALEALPSPLDGAFLVLGDQPRLLSSTLDTLAQVAHDPVTAHLPLVVPRYADDPGPRNPVLVRRTGWHMVKELDGDHGLAPLIALHPELVLDVFIDGEMPDVDRPEDLERLRLAKRRRQGT